MDRWWLLVVVDVDAREGERIGDEEIGSMLGTVTMKGWRRLS